MTETIKRDAANEMLRLLNTCKVHLKKQNLYSCLINFREVLKKALSTKMLAQDEKQVLEEINSFQKALFDSKIYRDFFGPATFHNNDLKTTLDFINMLIDVEEEEIRDKSKTLNDSQIVDSFVGNLSLEEKISFAKAALDRGDLGKAQEILEGDEEAANMLFELLVDLGIRFRKKREFEKAIREYHKALLIYPDDECVYYNMARAYLEMGAFDLAEIAIEKALELNPNFTQAIELRKYLKHQTSKIH
ncbi:MAG: tetratricopeptide repeat protein [Syntrophales bacterium]|nr:tetratricopeptide repeat protein [Syntrophales bacterium]